jgi:hypothetical protein
MGVLINVEIGNKNYIGDNFFIGYYVGYQKFLPNNIYGDDLKPNESLSNITIDLTGITWGLTIGFSF